MYTDPVPSLRPKFSALGHGGVVIAKGEENGFELGLFAAGLQRVLAKVVQRFVDIGAHTRRRFVGDFYSRFQYTLVYPIALISTDQRSLRGK